MEPRHFILLILAIIFFTVSWLLRPRYKDKTLLQTGRGKIVGTYSSLSDNGESAGGGSTGFYVEIETSEGIKTGRSVRYVKRNPDIGEGDLVDILYWYNPGGDIRVLIEEPGFEEASTKNGSIISFIVGVASLITFIVVFIKGFI